MIINAKMQWLNFILLHFLHLEASIDPDSDDEFQYNEVPVDDEYSVSGRYNVNEIFFIGNNRMLFPFFVCVKV